MSDDPYCYPGTNVLRNKFDIREEMKRIFRELTASDYLCGLDADAFAERLAYFCSEIDAVHPFREGNSRTLRQFSADLARSAGHELDWEA